MRTAANRIAHLAPSSAKRLRRLRHGADGRCMEGAIFEPINSQAIIELSRSQSFILS